MKNILMIGTGGTIASLPGENGLVPQLSTDELLKAMPQLKTIAWIDSLQLINLDSTNIRPEHLMLMARTIKENYDRYDGFVITHGTDTMAYTAAGLSYLIQDSAKPIVITGAQVPLAAENSDAPRNMRDALLYAVDENSHGIQVVFSGSVILATRVRKNYTKRFDAFYSVNYPEIAHIVNGHILRFFDVPGSRETRFYDTLNTNVGLLKLVPGLKSDVLRYLLETYDGLVIESFGNGGIPEYYDYFNEVLRATEKGKVVVMTTQVPNEGSDISLYEVGNLIKKATGLLESYDMTSEACLAKLMWVLEQTRDINEVKKLFYSPIGNDILRNVAD